MISLPDTITHGGLEFNRVFDPGVGVTRRSSVDMDGYKRDLVIIQSPPTKQGRQRSVVRYTGTSLPDAKGFINQATATLTIDRAASDTDYAGNADLAFTLLDLLGRDGMAAVVQGQQ